MSLNTLNSTALAAVLLAASLGTYIQSASAQSRHYCDRQARAYASDHANGAGVVGGAVGGAVTGAIIGSIIDGGKGAGRGAAIGGGLGAVGGAVHESKAWRSAYNRAYHRCMAANHQAPAQARYDRPEPWSDEWYDYCADKYRSFNPDTGRYLTYSGRYRLCR